MNRYIEGADRNQVTLFVNGGAILGHCGGVKAGHWSSTQAAREARL